MKPCSKHGGDGGKPENKAFEIQFNPGEGKKLD